MPPKVTYHRSVMLAVPLIADRDVYDELFEVFHDSLVPTAQLTEYARSQGCHTPTDAPGWTIGVQPALGEPHARRLVWFQPEKLRRIQQMIDTVSRDHPEATKFLVMQGSGWDDIGVVPPHRSRHRRGHDKPRPAAPDRGTASRRHHLIHPVPAPATFPGRGGMPNRLCRAMEVLAVIGIWRDQVYIGVGLPSARHGCVDDLVWTLAYFRLMRAASSIYKDTSRRLCSHHGPRYGLVLRLRWNDSLIALQRAIDDAMRDFRAGMATSRRPAVTVEILLDGDRIEVFGSIRTWRVPHPDITESPVFAVALADLAGHLVHPTLNTHLSQIAEGHRHACIPQHPPRQ